jgi:arsenate reductase
MEEQEKKSVLFLSIHNSVRSQMAEGLLKHFRGDKFEAFSAGVEPTDIDPIAVQVMKEIEIDIINYRSKPIEYFNAKTFDYAISICASASEERPGYPHATTQLSWDFPDPSKMTGSEQVILDEYRKLRDNLTQKIRDDLLAGM